ncbi:MAG: glycosyltransferase family 9 protein [Rhodospirillaceae bacterium]|nr:glycosyltransferase family 9 protein [Rhodospirillaceae bacterium]
MAETNILVIKLGAFGDFLYALGPMQAIRRHHPTARLSLLTRPAYRDLAERSGLFDEIQIDDEPKAWNIAGVLRLRRWLRGAGFTRVYDLQTSDRTSSYRKLFCPGPWPEWSGIVPGDPLYHHYKRPTLTHTIDRQREQLRIAGINDVARSDVSFMDGDITRFALSVPFVLLIPGSSAKMKIKRWPAEKYADLANRLAAKGLTPVVLGGAEEADAIEVILSACAQAVSLSGQTTIFDIPALGRRAASAIGNDTGPMHAVALTGCPTVAIFSELSFPAKAGPRGEHVRLLVRENLADLPVDEVEAAVMPR